MEIKDLLNSTAKTKEDKQRNELINNMFIAGVTASAYGAYFYNRRVKKWIKGKASRFSKEFISKVRKVSKKIAPTAFELAQNDTNYSTLLNSLTITPNSESILVAQEFISTKSEISKLKERISKLKNNINITIDDDIFVNKILNTQNNYNSILLKQQESVASSINYLKDKIETFSNSSYNERITDINSSRDLPQLRNIRNELKRILNTLSIYNSELKTGGGIKKYFYTKGKIDPQTIKKNIDQLVFPILQSQRFAEIKPVEKIWKLGNLSQNTNNEEIFKLNKYVSNFIVDNKTFKNQIKQSRRRFIQLAVDSGASTVGLAAKSYDSLFGFNINLKASKFREFFVDNMLDILSKQKAVKNVTVLAREYGESTNLIFRLANKNNKAIDLKVPIPTFFGRIQTGATSAFIVNQHQFMSNLMSSLERWAVSYLPRFDFFTEPSQFQDIEKIFNDTVTNLISKYNSSQNDVININNAFMMETNLEKVYSKLPKTQRDAIDQSFKVAKKLQKAKIKNSKYKTVFIDIEFNPIMNPYDMYGKPNSDISELAFQYLDNLGEYKSFEYEVKSYQKSKNVSIEKKTKGFPLSNRTELARFFLKNVKNIGIENITFVTKSGRMAGADLDRLVGMLKDYNKTHGLNSNDQYLIKQTINRLLNPETHIDMQSFMVGDNLSLKDYYSLGSKKGEVLEERIFQIYKDAGQRLKKKFDIILQRDPDLKNRITSRVKDLKHRPPTYIHSAASDAKTMSIYFDMRTVVMESYDNLQDYLVKNSIHPQLRKTLGYTSTSSPQQMFAEKVTPFDFSSIFSANNQWANDKIRHMMNGQYYELSSSPKYFIPNKKISKTYRNMSVLNEDLKDFLIPDRRGQLKHLTDNLFDGLTFFTLNDHSLTSEGSVVYNEKSVGQAYIEHFRSEIYTVKMRENLRVGSIIPPMNNLNAVSEVNDSFIGIDLDGFQVNNISGNYEKVVNIKPDPQRNGYAIVETKKLMPMGTGQKFSFGGQSGIGSFGANSIYDFIITNTAWKTSNKERLINQILGTIAYKAEGSSNEIKQRVKKQLSSFDWIRKVVYNNNKLQIITKTLHGSKEKMDKTLSEALSNVGSVLKSNFSIGQSILNEGESSLIPISVSTIGTTESYYTKSISHKEWAKRIALSVQEMMSKGRFSGDFKHIQELFISITNPKYHKHIKEYMTFTQDKTISWKRYQLLKNIFEDKSTGKLFDVGAIQTGNIIDYLVGTPSRSSVALTWDEMQGNKLSRTANISNLFLLLTKMNADSDETLKVYKNAIEQGVDARLGYNIRTNINTNKSIQTQVDKMVNLNDIFKTNKSLSDLIVRLLHGDTMEDSVSKILDFDGTTRYEVADTKVVKRLNQNDLKTLRSLHELVNNYELDSFGNGKIKGAYYTKNGKKFWLSADDLLVRNTEQRNRYLISRNLHNLMRLVVDDKFELKHALSEEKAWLAPIENKRLMKAIVPGLNLVILPGLDVTTSHTTKDIKRGYSLFANEFIMGVRSIEDVPNINNYIKNLKLADMKADVAYMIDYKSYIKGGKPQFNIKSAENLRYRAIKEAEEDMLKTSTTQEISKVHHAYSDSVKKFYHTHKQTYTEFLSEVLKANQNFKDLKSFQDKMKTAIELEMMPIRATANKMPAGSSYVYTNERIFIHKDENIDRLWVRSASTWLEYAKRDFDGDTINIITTLSSGNKNEAYGYFERDYLKGKKRIEMLRQNGLLKENYAGLKTIENSRLVEVKNKLKYEDVVSKITYGREVQPLTEMINRRAYTGMTKEFAAQGFRKGWIGVMGLLGIKNSTGQTMDTDSLRELFDFMSAPEVEAPLAMNKFTTQVQKAFETLDKSQDAQSRRLFRKMMKDPIKYNMNNNDLKTFSKFITDPFRVLYYNGQIYNKGAVEMFTNWGFKIDTSSKTMYLEEGSRLFNELTSDDIIVNATKRRYLESLDMRGLIPQEARRQGIDVVGDFSAMIGSDSVAKAMVRNKYFGLSDIMNINSMVLKDFYKPPQDRGILELMIPLSEKYIKKGKKLAPLILGAVGVASFIGGNTLGDTPGDYISNNLFSWSEDESNLSNEMNLDIKNQTYNRLHLQSPIYRQKFNYENYVSELIQTQPLHSIIGRHIPIKHMYFN